MGKFNGALMLGQVLGQPGIEFDARKFEFIGAAVKEDVACALTKASGITSVEKWAASPTPVKLGGTGPAASPDNTGAHPEGGARAPDPAGGRLQGHRGDPAGGRRRRGGGGLLVLGVDARRPGAARSTPGDVVPVVQATGRPFPDLPNVPLAINLAKSDEARRLIQVGIQNSGAFARPFVLPPGHPEGPCPDRCAARSATP